MTAVKRGEKLSYISSKILLKLVSLSDAMNRTNYGEVNILRLCCGFSDEAEVIAK